MRGYPTSGRLDKSSYYLSDLRERLGLSQERICARCLGLEFNFSGAISSEHNDAGVGAAFMSKADNVEAIWILRCPQAQVLDDHLILTRLDQPLGLINFLGRFNVLSMMSKVLLHGKTD